MTQHAQLLQKEGLGNPRLVSVAPGDSQGRSPLSHGRPSLFDQPSLVHMLALCGSRESAAQAIAQVRGAVNVFLLFPMLIRPDASVCADWDASDVSVDRLPAKPRVKVPALLHEWARVSSAHGRGQMNPPGLVHWASCHSGLLISPDPLPFLGWARSLHLPLRGLACKSVSSLWPLRRRGEGGLGTRQAGCPQAVWGLMWGDLVRPA